MAANQPNRLLEVTGIAKRWLLKLSGPMSIALLCLASPASSAEGEDAVELEGMSVIGNQELPKALIIVPWKDPEAALAPERPLNTLIDEALQPVDPETFRRTLHYYDMVHRTD